MRRPGPGQQGCPGERRQPRRDQDGDTQEERTGRGVLQQVGNISVQTRPQCPTVAKDWIQNIQIYLRTHMN